MQPYRNTMESSANRLDIAYFVAAAWPQLTLRSPLRPIDWRDRQHRDL